MPEILKAGDDSGNRMVVRYSFPDSVKVYGIGVPQTWQSPIGPTWSYVVEGNKLTLVDTGCYGSIQYLEEGLESIGYSLSAVERVVVTHGHMDHDGNCFDVVAKSGAELWAHEVYSRLVNVDRWGIENEFRQHFSPFPPLEDDEFVERIRDYEKQSRELKVTNVVTDGLDSDRFTFLYTPGHSPDELCILFEKVLFSGDHILPQITPHPSVSLSYKRFRNILPEGYQGGNGYYGLKVYLQSLGKVLSLGDDLTVMPAHRAFYRGKFNPIGIRRGREIIEHHQERFHHILDLLRSGPLDMENVTRKHFSGHHLEARNYYLAFSEIVSHIELLQEMGDVEMVGGEKGLIHWKGTEHFAGFVEGLLTKAT